MSVLHVEFSSPITGGTLVHALNDYLYYRNEEILRLTVGSCLSNLDKH